MLGWGANLSVGYKKLLSNSQLFFPKKTINFSIWWNDAKSRQPLYRMGYFGQKIEVLNIQWAGKLTDIQNHLEKYAWHTLPKTKIYTTLYKLSLHSNDPNLPLFVSSNAGQAPALTMTKYFPTTHNLLVINLWDSHKMLNNGIPLWLGLVHYHKTWHLQFQSLKKQMIMQPLIPLINYCYMILKHIP